jgi:predicted esterase
MALGVFFFVMMIGFPAAADFELRAEQLRPFQSVRIWAPRDGRTKLPALILLHGNQGHLDNPTWLADIRFQRELSRHVLFVPALDGYDWERPGIGQALAGLVQRERSVDQEEIFLLGYSAGASRVLAVADALVRRGIRVRGIIAIAGDVLRPIRQGSPLLKAPLLLICMEQDTGRHTSCRQNETNAARLRGQLPLTFTRVAGTHQLEFDMIVPLIAKWLASQT